MGCVACRNGFGDASARFPLGGDGYGAGLHYGHKVVEYPVGYIFIENAGIAELKKIIFERFEFNATVVGNIAEGDGPEIGQAGFWTYRCELRIDDFNGIVAVGVGVVEYFENLFFHRKLNGLVGRCVVLLTGQK